MLIFSISLISVNKIQMNLCLKWRLVDTISTKTNKKFIVCNNLWLQSMVAIDVAFLNQYEKLQGRVFWSWLLAWFFSGFDATAFKRLINLLCFA